MQLKKLQYLTIILLCMIPWMIGYSSSLLAVEYQWPPENEQPVVTLIGPFYEAETETREHLYNKLKQVMRQIEQNFLTILPQFYQDRIQKLQYMQFIYGYQDSEEWSSIKNQAKRGKYYNNEIIAGILQSNKLKKPGLELAIRVTPSRADKPDQITLEGYKYIRQPGGTGLAEWYTQHFSLKGRTIEKTMTDAIIWLLNKPFRSVSKYNVDNRQIPYWQTDSKMGTLEFKQTHFVIDPIPVRREFVMVCISTNQCHSLSLGDSSFAVVKKARDAMAICESMGKQLISPETLLLMTQNSQIRDYLERQAGGFTWAHSKDFAVAIKFQESFKHFRRKHRQGEGSVWCQPRQPDKKVVFSPAADGTVVSKGVNSLVWYAPDRDWEKGTLLEVGGITIVKVIGHDIRHRTLIRGEVLNNAFNPDVQEGEVTSFDYFNDQYRGFIASTYSVNLKVIRKGAERSVSDVPIQRMGLNKGHQVTQTSWSAGWSYPGVTKIKVRTIQGEAEIKAGILGFFFEHGIERSVPGINGLRWSAFWGIEGFTFSQEYVVCYQYAGCEDKTSTANLFFFNASARLNYIIRRINLFGGLLYTPGSSGEFSDGSLEKIVVESGLAPIMGFTYIF